MNMLRGLPIFITTAAILSACAGGKDVYLPSLLDDAKKMSPQGSAFNQALHKNYVAQSEFEVGQNDSASTGVFAHRAIVAGGGNSILPEAIAKRDLPAGTVGELTNARTRLLAALDGGARDRLPDLAAKTQVKFDCWMEQQEENIQPDHISACKIAFMDLIPKLEVTPVAAAPAPLPKVPGPYIIYFDFDSFDLTDESLAVIAAASEAAKAAKVTRVIIGGHTDRAGSNDYNKGLSRARVIAAGNALFKAGGATRKNIVKNYYGEEKPRVQTADGQREDENRRVEIRFER